MYSRKTVYGVVKRSPTVKQLLIDFKNSKKAVKANGSNLGEMFGELAMV
jgi:hypothetical protein